VNGQLSVDKERWERAQEWELDFWRRNERRAGWKRFVYPIVRPVLSVVRSRSVTGDDWNLWWRNQFEDYTFLPSEVGDYIELGCGPYTNTRLVMKSRSATRLVCSDPLADEYVKFRGRWLANAAANGLVEIDAHPIEDLPFPPGSFDVVVLINVLDHVMDADSSLRTAIDLLRPGGYFIFGQNLANPDIAGQHEWFEEGHPIRLTAADVERHLQGFTPLIDKTLPPNDPPLHTGVLIFAGVRR
jgi:SAM-dependent methyltransferase